MRVAPRVLIGGLINSWGRQRTIALLPWLVLAIGLAGTAAVSEQTRRFGEQEHLRIESTLLDNVSDALRNKLEINISMLAGVVGLAAPRGLFPRRAAHPQDGSWRRHPLLGDGSP